MRTVGTTSLHLASALLPGGFTENVRLEFDGARIGGIASNVAPAPGDRRYAIGVPGMGNVHSHAFQRAMVGLSERSRTGGGNFWSWRELMYHFALAMRPDELEAVASELYLEMLEAGFTRVGEFHYLHHDQDGRPYASIAEMGERIIAAAKRVGIGLTLLPSFYAHGGFGGEPPQGAQRRFVNDVGRFSRLLEATRAAARAYPETVVGTAAHSLRAVSPEELTAVVGLAGDGPIHIHAAEQVREVTESVRALGAPPVAWLLAHQALDRRWCVIHATHMTARETADLAKSDAIVGLCPITEANLGDGAFDAVPFVAAGGRFGVGSDCNVEIGLAAELRQLEYVARLGHRARNVLATPGKSTGRSLFEAALEGGGAALGVVNRFCVGAPADVVTLRRDHPSYPELAPDRALDTWIFSAGNTLIESVWAGGRLLVEGGRHRARAAVAERYRAALARLTA